MSAATTPGAALLSLVAETRLDALPKSAVEMGRLAVLDWWGVTVGGVDEPVTRLLREADARAARRGLGAGYRPHGVAVGGGPLERHRVPRARLRRHRHGLAWPRDGAALAGAARARGDTGGERSRPLDGVRARRRGHVPRVPRARPRALSRGLARHRDARPARQRRGMRPSARPRCVGHRSRRGLRRGPDGRHPRVVRDDGKALPGRPRRRRRAPVRHAGRGGRSGSHGHSRPSVVGPTAVAGLGAGAPLRGARPGLGGARGLLQALPVLLRDARGADGAPGSRPPARRGGDRGGGPRRLPHDLARRRPAAA